MCLLSVEQPIEMLTCSSHGVRLRVRVKNDCAERQDPCFMLDGVGRLASTDGVQHDAG